MAAETVSFSLAFSSSRDATWVFSDPMRSASSSIRILYVLLAFIFLVIFPRMGISSSQMQGWQPIQL